MEGSDFNMRVLEKNILNFLIETALFIGPDILQSHVIHLLWCFIGDNVVKRTSALWPTRWCSGYFDIGAPVKTEHFNTVQNSSVFGYVIVTILI